MSKIEQIIGEIEEYIEGCRFQPLSNTKITVNKDELCDLLDDLRQNIPDEVKKYQRIIANRDAILKDAQDKAEDMIKKANEMTSTLVSEHEIMQQAFREANALIEDANSQANTIIENATAEANSLKISAIQYTDDALGNIQNILNTAIEGMTVKYDGIMRSLESSLDVATKDRQALREFSASSRKAMDEEAVFTPSEEYQQAQAPQQPYDSYIADTFEPGEEPMDDYRNISVEEAYRQEDAVNDVPARFDNVSDYGSVDEIKDFDLAFDDFK
ncbi:MAG: ATPase [Parasporobacterium sp.]|nr:ATPase [Parasporobacterium sp.]